ncbi:MAG: sensor histidine kinase [Chloroflexi bacterium]|nr:sensor histidine kinase [Chloroflexota bacterium]
MSRHDRSLRGARPPWYQRMLAGLRVSSSHPGSQLAAVTVPIILLLTAAALAFAWRGYERSVAMADHEMQLLAVTAAVDAERFLANRIETLRALSPAAVLARGDLDEIHAYLSGVVSLSGFSEIGWVDTQGYAQTVGGAEPLRTPLDVGDRPHVTQALQMQVPVVGAAQISRVSQEPTMNVVVPVKDGGRLVALLAGAVRLTGPKTADLRFGGVDGLRALDGHGQVAVVGEQEGLRELRSVTAWPDYATVRSAESGVLRTRAGILGEPDRVVGFAAVSGSDWVVLVDRPQSVVYGDAWRIVTAEIALSTVFAATSLLFVAWAAFRLDAGTQRFVLFIDTLTHDVGTPLTVIRAHANRLQRTLRTDPARLASVTEIERAGRRIERMVQGLADLLGPSRHPELVRNELDFVTLVREMVAEYEMRTGRTIRYTPGLRSMLGEWDGLRLERLVDNLLSNAIKYSGADSDVLVELSEEQRPEGRRAVLEVRDFGIGIPKEEQRAIWTRFRRGSNTQGIPGKGVGLASVRQIAEEHDGSVHLLSSPGQGTVVTVRLPWPEDRPLDLDDEADEVPSPALGGSPDARGHHPPAP